MSAIAGVAATGKRLIVERMLDRIDYRGNMQPGAGQASFG